VDFLQTLTDQAFLPEIPQHLPSGLPPGRAARLAPEGKTALHHRSNNNSSLTAQLSEQPPEQPKALP
jgi:hypothetical protein